ncbi:MAG: hypothetical protein QNJ20_15215 [Paracoccaceae bacterium]|nr:hypothetical protein [Paracoccaceae bacterium]
MVAEDREVISAKVSQGSAAGWRKFCEDNGVSLAALLEVAGLHLADETNPPTTTERIEMIEEARAIDIQRRSRRT